MPHLPRQAGNCQCISGQRSRARQRRGAIILLVAISLPVLMLLVGFSIDLSHMQRVDTELRVATDLAAKAAADALARTESTAQAIAAGKTIASSNLVGGVGLALEDDDFVFGAAQLQPSGKWTFVESAVNPNAVQVSGDRTAGSQAGAVNLFFGNLIGKSNFEPSVTAAAAFPLIDICLVVDRSTSMKMDIDEAGGMYTTDPRWCLAPDTEARWQGLDTALRAFVGDLQATPARENLALVTFGGAMVPEALAVNCSGSADHSVVSIDQGLTIDSWRILDALTDRTNAVWNGNTDIYVGLATGINVMDGARSGAKKVIILMTDGMYTEADPLPLAAFAQSRDIMLHVITFGPDSDVSNPTGTPAWITNMKALATDGGGLHLHAPDAAALAAAYAELAANLSMLVQ